MVQSSMLTHTHTYPLYTAQYHSCPGHIPHLYKRKKNAGFNLFSGATNKESFFLQFEFNLRSPLISDAIFSSRMKERIVPHLADVWVLTEKHGLRVWYCRELGLM